MTQLSRRAAVQQVALAGAGLVILPNLGWLASAQERDREVVPFEDIPEGFSTRRPGDFALPGHATAGIDLRELTSWKTAPHDLLVVAHYNVPIIDAPAWRLRIDGLARRPLTLTLDDLRRQPRVERTVTFRVRRQSRRRASSNGRQRDVGRVQPQRHPRRGAAGSDGARGDFLGGG